ncbi:DUF4878 domain-containing protein [Bacteroides sp. OttesenSCG-928-D19]|nr:DUF4878 domain-containing protein [Bacteroides sp. OttesenSCG-928-N06]MDL2305152.1 DUF4878 domain-containing protein [Bacteroides sp. OttesenSCG-928-D19]
MKKVFYFGLVVLAMTILAACSSGAGSPGKVAAKYATYLADGQYEKFLDGLAMPDNATPEEFKEQKDMLLSMLKEKGDQMIQERGKLQKVEVVSEDIAEDGETAKVKLLNTYEKGESEDQTFKMMKQNGKWKIVLEK